MNIKALRESKGITQQRLADDTGIDRALIARYENGTRKPPIDNLVILSDYFGVSIDEVVGVPPKPPSDADLKFALFGGDKEITDAQFEEVKKYARYLKERGEL